jgi:hypothetical protein
MTACLQALGDDQIAASVNRLLGFRDRADLPAANAPPAWTRLIKLGSGVS